MSIYETKVSDLPSRWLDKVTVVPNARELSRAAAAEFADLLAEKQKQGELLTAICPVGPLDFRFFAEQAIKRGLSCRNLRTINMDEYLDENDRLIPMHHPLSFRRFMEETFFSLLPPGDRPLPENVIFPDPDAPEKITRLIDSIDGADICWAGLGISGHVAFNDPPQLTGEPADLERFRNCRTRKITIAMISMGQMAMGGTNGNMEIIPKRAVTVGMYELLRSKRFHATFMRNWHAGLWRRALLGPVTSAFPGSLLQEHPCLKVMMTEMAAAPPLLETAQATGEPGGAEAATPATNTG